MSEVRKYWVIKTLPNGNFYVTHEWLLNTSGLEVYSSEQEATEALPKKIKFLSEKGNCPRCYYSGCTETTRSLTHLTFLQSAKYGGVYLCKDCKTHWFVHEDKTAIAYSAKVADYLLEWCERTLLPTTAQSNFLKTCLNISTSKTEQLFAVGVKLKNGKNFPKVYLYLRTQPPSETNFIYTKKWHYLDNVEEIYQSEFAYNKSIANEIKRMYEEKIDQFIYFKDEEDKVYMMSPFVGYFMPDILAGKKLTFVNTDPIDHQKNNCIFISEKNHYDFPDDYTVFPNEVISVFGKLN
ncbi:MAG: hypothetical protein O9302_07945 [Cyclobacteriaceae bacterium]|nr:hypothetical protein [Cytophagales bacterium]MCZ8327975.1 hypothetical protein [Cyclobacteriaceae bacterium]